MLIQESYVDVPTKHGGDMRERFVYALYRPVSG